MAGGDMHRSARGLLALYVGCMLAVAPVPECAATLTIEVFGNSVMRGTPRCTVTRGNGFEAASLAQLCGGPLANMPPLGAASVRITGTLTAPNATAGRDWALPTHARGDASGNASGDASGRSSEGRGEGSTGAASQAQWLAFRALLPAPAYARVWIDDLRLIDLWSGTPSAAPVTPALLPNVSMTPGRPVSVRIDLRPWNDTVGLSLLWRRDAAASYEAVPEASLSPAVSPEQAARRALQERVATGWNQWWRHSALAHLALPHQMGVDIGVRQRGANTEYRGGLLEPQFPSRQGPPVPIRMGRHSYDGAYSVMSLVPFPAGTAGVPASSALNVTVEAGTTAPYEADGVRQLDRFVRLSCNATQAAAAAAANLSYVVHPLVAYGAHANVSRVDDAAAGTATLVLDAGELGRLTVAFSQRPVPAAAISDPRCQDGGDPAPFACLAFRVTEEPLLISLSFAGATSPNATRAAATLAAARAATDRTIATATATLGGSAVLGEAFEAMMTAMAWNANYEPRVGVTVPVSRTFEQPFDYIFFDWDMFFLSLMASSAPAGDDPASFEVGVSNLIEVTLTRSNYGQVMNKRAARGSSSSDTNDRTEPLVGAQVVWRLCEAAAGTPREATMAWVARLLYPVLRRWHQWAWENRRYRAGEPRGGLLVLGSDNNEPCEGSTVGLNASRTVCGNLGAAILESGMDNSAMYFGAFDDPATPGRRVPAGYDAAANRVQLYDCQQSALFVAEARALERLAALSGAPGDVPALRAQGDAIAALINAVLWDDATGVYRQVDASPANRGFSPEISPTSFYPAIAGVASPAQLQRMLDGYLTNASEFCVAPGPEGGACPYAIPVTSRQSPAFLKNTYWQGRTWGPTNLLTWMALSAPRYANMTAVRDARQGLCRQSVSLLLGEWRAHRHVHENYNSTSGRGGDVRNSNPFYHWGANLGWIAMQEALGDAGADADADGGALVRALEGL